MYRIDHPTNVNSLPTPAAIATEGYWTKGNPGVGQAATVLDQDWFNMVQESLIALIDGAGLSHSKSDYSQLIGALRAHGQCQLQYVSTTQIKLAPYNGNIIRIAGKAYLIPSAGVTLSNAGLSASTLYYIYLYNNAGTLTLEASATGHSTDTTLGNIGIEIKTGDPSRTLVGMIATDSGSHFASTDGNLLVASYFNRRRKVSVIIGGVYNISWLTYAELTSAPRNNFVMWADDSPYVTSTVGLANNTTNDGAGFSIGLDGSATFVFPGVIGGVVSAANFALGNSASLEGGSEGKHFLTLCGTATGGGVATFSTPTSQITIFG